MAYESDSSEEGSMYAVTNVMLGYASEEPTEDEFSQLGGPPKWPDVASLPSAEIAKCKTCNSLMCLLLQLNGDLPSTFQGHERRLYIFACRDKACRRKVGSVRAIRGTKIHEAPVNKNMKRKALQASHFPPPNLGDSIFALGSKDAPSTTNSLSLKGSSLPSNPFSSQPAERGNPFTPPSAQSATPSPTQHVASDLPTTFASKARISSPPPQRPSRTSWPTTSLPTPYPTYHLDAEYESLEPSPHPSRSAAPSKTQIDADPTSAEPERDLFESNMDKTFQKFAERLAQNPEQVLRYEFGGSPLLYNKNDSVGKKLTAQPVQQGGGKDTKVRTRATRDENGIPNCTNCGKRRVFELQLVPHAIAELEGEETGLDGMDWGTIIMGVCSEDCTEKGLEDGEWSWLEEWIGVQWEELGKTGKP